MRILIIKAQSQYGGTRLFCDEAAEAFTRRGDEVELLDTISNELAIGRVVAAAQGARFDLVLSMNILGELRDPGGRTMAELFGCPHVVWYTDYPLTFIRRLEGTPSSTPILVVDPTQMDAIKAALGSDRFDTLRFFPHPAVGQPIPDEPDVDAFLAARDIPVLWSGGFVKPSRPWSNQPAATQKVMDAAVEMALSVEWMPPHEALAAALKDIGVDIADPTFRGTLESAPMIDREVRETRRHAFLMAVAKAKLELHICGVGWEPQLYRFKNAVYHGAVEMTEAMAMMRRARLVLNTNGNFGAGSHERPFSASLAGAAVASDSSRYYEQVFSPGENIELFRWQDLAGGIERIQALAADPERCFRYAKAAKALTAAGHTWDRRIEIILEAAGLG
jgi:hypothetical protein